jgi:hypothetical protein
MRKLKKSIFLIAFYLFAIVLIYLLFKIFLNFFINDESLYNLRSQIIQFVIQFVFYVSIPLYGFCLFYIFIFIKIEDLFNFLKINNKYKLLSSLIIFTISFLILGYTNFYKLKKPTFLSFYNDLKSEILLLLIITIATNLLLNYNLKKRIC